VIADAPHLAIRAASLYVVVVLLFAVWMWRRPGPRAQAAALLACCWNLPVLLALQLFAQRTGWWRFDAAGGVLLQMPVDLYLSWACLWGAIPAIACPRLPLVAVVAVALAFDFVLMPAAAPVLALGPDWLVGEAIGLLVGLVPAQLLARWTQRDTRLPARAVLQVATFSGLIIFVLPVIVIEGTGAGWHNPFDLPAWQLSLILQALAVPAVVGLTAVQEFAARGNGTPVPFDPPRRLVTSGIYAYVRSPMQLSAMVLLALLGWILRNPWIAAAGVMAHVYSLGLAGADEDEDLRARFGNRWMTYRAGVRRWTPRWRPWFAPDRQPARLYVAASCDMCQEVGLWFGRRGARHLVIVPAESHRSGALTRITYEPGDGSAAESGVAALARALEHIHLAWALVGCALRLPGVARVAQLLVDASGGEPRPIAGSLLSRSGVSSEIAPRQSHGSAGHVEDSDVLRALRLEVRRHRHGQ
jgi:protein-S-isoprenylcysteine O-methyltransferase Ste14